MRDSQRGCSDECSQQGWGILWEEEKLVAMNGRSWNGKRSEEPEKTDPERIRWVHDHWDCKLYARPSWMRRCV